MMISRYFSQNQLKGLLKTGDIVLPGTPTSPSFSQTGCIRYMDRMLAYLSEDDLAGLGIVFSVFRWSPRWFIHLMLLGGKHNWKLPGAIGAVFRMLELGIKGAVMSPYYANLTAPDYAGPNVFDIIGWDAKMAVPEDTAPDKPMAVNLDHPSPEDAPAIFERARAAQPVIRDWGVQKRLEFIRNLKAVILRRREYILDRIQQDTQKSRTDALTAEIFGTVDHLNYLEKHAPKILADRKVPTPFALMGKTSKIFFEPMGTALIISPWNYPFYQAIVPITLAFTVGNAVVYKPSMVTPLKGLVEELLAEAGFAPEWVQIVYGPGNQVGDLLVDQRPDKIFFIGSQQTGRHLMKRAAELLIPVELEMGGKDPMIVFEDVDIHRAAAGAIWGAFTTTGQSCTSVEKLFIHEDIYEDFKTVLVRETEKLIQQIDTDGNADIGPMTTEAQTRVIADQVTDAKAKGAVLLTGGNWDGVTPFIPPMVIEGTTDDMRLNSEETFGPLLPIFKFKDEQEVIDLANDPEFGLSASVWSHDLKRAERVARALDTGNVSINNVMLTEGNHALPFGGTRKSGIGRYKGEFGFYCFANIKSILVDKNSGKMEANWFPYTTKKYKIFSELTEAIYSPGVVAFLKSLVHGLRLETYAARLKKKGRE